MATSEKITRTVFQVCKGLKIKHQVVFGSKKDDETRRGELNKYEYNSSKYTDVTRLVSYNLETSDYLIFECNTYGREKLQIFVSYPHFYRVKRAFKEAVKWFNDDKYSDLFIYRGNTPIFNSDFKNIEAVAYNLVSNSAIRITPTTIEIESEIYEGVTVCFNSELDFVTMTIDQLEAVSDFLDSFRLYEASQLLINYITSIEAPSAQTMQLDKKTGVTSTHKESMPLNKKVKTKKKKIVIDENDD